MYLFTPEGKLIGVLRSPPPPPRPGWDVWHFVIGIGLAVVVAMVTFV